MAKTSLEQKIDESKILKSAHCCLQYSQYSRLSLAILSELFMGFNVTNIITLMDVQRIHSKYQSFMLVHESSLWVSMYQHHYPNGCPKSPK